MKKTIFSGIQPSGGLHIGNYVGAISQWKAMQDEGVYDLIFCIVDLHAITVAQDPAVLRKNILELAALYMACGIDPKKSNLFVQSQNPDHPYLGWIFNCVTPMGWMDRMTQYKEKEAKQKERASLGLYSYPTLMAADILLYDTHIVPVGEDQRQHVELARDIAKRFNSQYGETFVLPQAQIDEGRGRRIMSLQNPSAKMSKSDEDQSGCLYLLDEPDMIVKKIKRAVTDSASTFLAESISDGLDNLLTIFTVVSGRSKDELIKQYDGRGYGDFKGDLAEQVVAFLSPIQERYAEIVSDSSHVATVLEASAQAVRERSSQKVAQVTKAMGLGL